MRLAKISFLLLLSLLVACGDATRNSGGTSVLFFGWFNDVNGTEGVSGATVTLQTIDQVIPFAGIQNNLAGQTYTIQTIHNSYTIPGSNISIPNSVTAANGLVRPTALAGDSFGNPISTLPAGAFGDGGSYVGVYLVPPQVKEFLSFNRGSFPEAPFSVLVTSYFEGVTSAGKNIRTNETTIELVVLSDITVVAGGAAAGLEGDVEGDQSVDASTASEDDVVEGTQGTGVNSDVTFF